MEIIKYENAEKGANSGVMMKNYIENEKEGYKIAKEIYKKAVEEMFK